MSLDDNVTTFPSTRGTLSFTAAEWERAETAIARMRAAARERCVVIRVPRKKKARNGGGKSKA